MKEFMCKSTLDYNNQDWSSHFYMDTTSGSGLRRKSGKLAGAVAGGKNFLKNGVGFGWRVRLGDKLYLAHRILWVMTYGSIDSTLVIDHLNGDAFDNSLANLQLKTQQHNTQNRSVFKTASKSGIAGVSFLSAKGYDYVMASWVYDKKQRTKLFSVAKYGKDVAILLASKHRDEQLKVLNTLGMNYTDRHCR